MNKSQRKIIIPQKKAILDKMRCDEEKGKADCLRRNLQKIVDIYYDIRGGDRKPEDYDNTPDFSHPIECKRPYVLT